MIPYLQALFMQRHGMISALMIYGLQRRTLCVACINFTLIKLKTLQLIESLKTTYVQWHYFLVWIACKEGEPYW